MKWPFRRPRPLTLGDIQELVSREVSRQLAVELQTKPILGPAAYPPSFGEGSPVISSPFQTRLSKLSEALDGMIPAAVRAEVDDWLRTCQTCGEAFLRPRRPSGAGYLYRPGPTDERDCPAHRSLAYRGPVNHLAG